jgi:hypothetical protein
VLSWAGKYMNSGGQVPTGFYLIGLTRDILTLSTPGCATSAAPAPPVPVTMLTTPAAAVATAAAIIAAKGGGGGGITTAAAAAAIARRAAAIAIAVAATAAVIATTATTAIDTVKVHEKNGTQTLSYGGAHCVSPAATSAAGGCYRGCRNDFLEHKDGGTPHHTHSGT